MTTRVADLLELADWRRRVAELYADVRRLATTDPEAAHGHWRAAREALYREHAASPLPPERRAGFVAHHYPYDPALRFEPSVLPVGDAAPPADEPAPPPAGEPPSSLQEPGAAGRLDLPASVGPRLVFERAGWLDVPFRGGVRRLAVFWLPEYSGGLFLPFRDATNGGPTYGGGRYVLDGAKSADLGGDAARGTVVVDFNFAYQPSCAWDPRWACPLSPPENRLPIPIEAGEMLG